MAVKNTLIHKNEKAPIINANIIKLHKERLVDMNPKEELIQALQSIAMGLEKASQKVKGLMQEVAKSMEKSVQNKSELNEKVKLSKKGNAGEAPAHESPKKRN